MWASFFPRILANGLSPHQTEASPFSFIFPFAALISVFLEITYEYITWSHLKIWKVCLLYTFTNHWVNSWPGSELRPLSLPLPECADLMFPQLWHNWEMCEVPLNLLLSTLSPTQMLHPKLSWPVKCPEPLLPRITSVFSPAPILNHPLLPGCAQNSACINMRN